MNWMLLPFRRYADFKGRSRRMEFWMFGLLNAIVYTVLVIAALAAGLPLGIIAEPSAALQAVGGGFMILIGIALALWWLVVLVPSIAVSVRRLHDRDMSGWWYLGLIVVGLVPFVGFIASIALLVLMFLPGTAGPNRFGLDPKDPAQADVFA